MRWRKMDNQFENKLIKIKLLINKYYEDIGRFQELTSQQMADLIEAIDEIVNTANLDRRKLILEKIENE